MTINKNKLKPCPFCGNNDFTIGKECIGHGSFVPKIECKCGASLAYPYEEDELIKKWNSRKTGNNE